MHIHILGICGTFMAGIATLARQLGHQVSGSDAAAWPPMSTQLARQQIMLHSGYESDHLDPEPDLVVIGNALSRGNVAVETTLNRGLPYTSGPQWLAEQVLNQRWILAVAGTHGKTTTSSMLAWILEYAGLSPGFLIGGVPENFGVSARLGTGPFFVVEADEYDSAFFDKRSKFIHYRARTLVLNNLEFDHADIFADLAAIQQQFAWLLRNVPGEGLIISSTDATLQPVIRQENRTRLETLNVNGNSDWRAMPLNTDSSHFEVLYKNQLLAQVNWSLCGQHNVHNALAAIAAARHVGVPPAIGCEALATFRPVKRRMELRGVVDGISVYDDFAHHPTAIAATLTALRQRVGSDTRIIAVLEARSNTMKMGVFQSTLADSLACADTVWLYESGNLNWSLQSVAAALPQANVVKETAVLVQQLVESLHSGDQVMIMSNGAFDNLHQRLLSALGGE